MKVSDLINKLSQFPPDLPVVISGYEYGVEDVEEITAAKYVPDVNDSCFAGPHDLADDNEDGYPCVFIRRQS